MAFLVLGKPVPPLPSWKDMETAPAPTNLHFPTLLKQIRHDASQLVAPYYIGKDVQVKSKEFEKLTPHTQTNLCSKLPPEGPYTGLFMAPEDFMAYLAFSSATYMSNPMVRICYGSIYTVSV